MLIRQMADPLSRGAYPFSYAQPDQRALFDPFNAREAAVDESVVEQVLSAWPALRHLTFEPLNRPGGGSQTS